MSGKTDEEDAKARIQRIIKYQENHDTYLVSLGGKEFYYSTRTNNGASKALALFCGFRYRYAEKKADLWNGKPYELEVYHKKI